MGGKNHLFIEFRRQYHS